MHKSKAEFSFKSGIRAACLASMLMAGTALAATSAIEQLYLQAEKENDPARAAKLWQDVLKQSSAEEPVPNVSRDVIVLHYLQALISAGNYKQAMQDAVRVESTRERAWVYIVLARKAAGERNKAAADAALAEAQKIFASLPSREDRSHIAYGAVTVLLAEGKDNIGRARKWADAIETAFHRSAAEQSIAAIESGEQAKDPSKLAEVAEDYLSDEDYENALKATLAIPLEQNDKRNELLLQIYEDAKSDDEFSLALYALTGMDGDDNQTEALLDWVEELVDEEDFTRAERVARVIDEGGDSVRAWGKLAKEYREEEQAKRLENAWKMMSEALARLKMDSRGHDIQAEAAKIFAETGAGELAEKALDEAGDSPKRFQAAAALVKSYAEDRKWEEADDALGYLDGAPEDLKANAVGELAYQYARRGKVDEAKELLEEYDGLDGDRIEKAKSELAKKLAQQKKNDEAVALVKKIKSKSLRREGELMLHAERFKQSKKRPPLGLVENTLREASGNEQELAALFPSALALGMVEEALKYHEGMKDETALLAAEKAIALFFADNREFATAEEFVKNIPTVSRRDHVASVLAVRLARSHKIAEATKITEIIADYSLRVTTYRKAAEIQAAYTDFYQLLGKYSDIKVDGKNKMVSPEMLPKERLSRAADKSFNDEMTKAMEGRTSEMVMSSPPDSALGRFIPGMERLRRLTYDEKYVRQIMPKTDPGFTMSLIDYRYNPYNEKFVSTMGSADFLKMQQDSTPRVILLEKGVADFAAIYDLLRELGEDELIKREGKTYTLRIPIIINSDATLVVEGSEVKELRMSTERGSYIVNAGKLFMLDSKVTSWLEAESKPPIAHYEDKYVFRPFITSWSRSLTYMAGNEFTGLGYSASKAYGISLSAGPKQLSKNQIDEARRPGAVIVDNSFRNMFYGFYSYEADHVVLVGNEYVNNIVYGIDPHDRSRWFTIAYNTAYGTEKKHGIIISREVNYSTILGNVSYHNHGTGIMIDRQSSGTLIYANTAFNNEQDGLTVFESNCKIIASNRFFGNGRAGIRVRNSMDVGIFFNVLSRNTSTGILGYTADLKTDPAHKLRDFNLDPFSDTLGMSVVGNWIEQNGSGLRTSGLTAMTLKHNRFVNQSPKLLQGPWTRAIPDLLTKYNLESEGIFVTSRCPKASNVFHETCAFRQAGYFLGDGQSNLLQRLIEQPCSTKEKQAAGANPS